MLRRLFLNSRKDRRKGGVFMRCRRTYVLKNIYITDFRIKYLRINKISIHINFYQNRFLNECVRKNFLKLPERQMTFLTFNDL